MGKKTHNIHENTKQTHKRKNNKNTPIKKQNITKKHRTTKNKNQ